MHLLPTEMFKWGKAEVGQQELESHRQELDSKIQLLEAKYRDAENAYRKMCAEGRGNKDMRGYEYLKSFISNRY